MTPKQRAFRYVHIVSIICIVLLAFILRSYNIENLPSGVYPDEAVNAADAIHAYENHDYRLFYENNQGREGLFINLQSIALQIFGLNIFALKFWSIIFGTLTVFGMYLLAWELWRKQSIALISAYITATSYWAINFSRIGFRAIMVPFILSFAFYFFFKGLRTKKFSAFALSGFIFALGLHTYIAFRVTPLIIIFLLPGLFLSYKNFLKIYWKHALIFILFAFIAAAPMLWDFYQHPTHFSSRSHSISIFSPEINHGNLLGTLTKTLGLSLIKYNFIGDQNFRHNYAPYPILDIVIGTTFLAGFIYMIYRTIFLLIRRLKHKDRNKELAINFFILGSFFTMLIPEFLTDESLPHALRSIGTIPAVILIASTPFLWMYERIKISQPGMKMIMISSIAILLFVSASINITKYFVFFANNPKQHASFNENFKNMALYLRILSPQEQKYVFTHSGGILQENNLPIAAQPIAFLTHNRVQNLGFLRPETPIDTEHIKTPAKIIIMENDDAFVASVQEKFPQTFMETVDLNPGYGSEFKVLVIPEQ